MDETVNGTEPQQAGQDANAQNPAQVQLKNLLQMTYPTGQPLFTQNEIAGYRQNYSNGQPLSQVLDFVKAEAIQVAAMAQKAMDSIKEKIK